MADLIDKFNELFSCPAPEPVEIKQAPRAITSDAWAAMTATMAESIRRSAVMRAELNKAIKAGGDPWDLLLQATEIIGLMTGDVMTHEIAKKFQPANEQQPRV